MSAESTGGANGASPVARDVSRKGRTGPAWWPALPGFVVLFLLFIGPMAFMLIFSLWRTNVDFDIVPDWIVGTSIGAINAALIAGNEQANRLQRVKAFWDLVSHPDTVDMASMSDDQRRSSIWLNTPDTVLRGVPKAPVGQVSEVQLEISVSNQIVRMVLVEQDGGTTEFRFKDWKENVELSDSRFRFTPPPGVETVEGALGP